MATIVPPARLEPGIGSALSQGLMFLGQGLGKRWGGQAFQKDIANLMAFQQAMQQYQQGINQPAATGTIAGTLEQGPLGGLGITEPTQPPLPVMQSPMGQQALMGGLMGTMFGDPFGVKQAQAGLYRAQAEATQNVLPKERLTRATTLRKEFQAHPVYRSYQTIERSEKSMRVAYEKSVADKSEKSRIASDQALGVLFQKLLDPDSVVRESEYARTPEGAGVMSRIRSYLPRLARGGLGIDNEDRRELYEMAEALLVVAKEQMNKHIANYTGFAQGYDVDPRLVLGNLKEFDIGGKPTAPSRQTGLQQRGIKQPGVLTATNPTTGKKIVSYDGGKTWQPTPIQ